MAMNRHQMVVDESEMVGLNELFRNLKDYHQEELGTLLCSCWKTLAGLLGLSNDEIRRIESNLCQANRAYEVLKVWRVRQDTTIRVLSHVLADMQHDEAIKKLDDIRCGKFFIRALEFR
jgi:Death domain